MLEKSRNAVFFQWFVCRVSRKVGSLKRRVRSHVVRGDIKNCTPLWREAHFQSKSASRYMFGALFEVELFKNCTPLWREAHFQSKSASRYMFGALFEVELLKNCTPLWREARFEVKMYKTQHSRTTFWSWAVEKLHAAVARSTFWSENVQNTAFSEHFWTFRCLKIARRCGEKHISKSKC